MLNHKFDPTAVAESLRRQGFAVIDDAVDRALCEELQAEFEDLHAADAFCISGNVVEQALLAKRGVAEIDFMVNRKLLAAPHLLAMCPRIAEILNADVGTHLLLPQLQQAFPTVRLSALDQLKVQRAESPKPDEIATGSFPMHFDTTPECESRRTVTVLLYLTDEDGINGGELEVFPFPAGQRCAVEPKFGRLVVFSSFFLAHRTCPLRPTDQAIRPPAARRALSLWFASEEQDNSVIATALLPRLPLEPWPALLSACDGDGLRALRVMKTAQAHQNLRYMTKLWLQYETEASFRDAYGRAKKNIAETVDAEDPAALNEAMKKHHATVAQLRGGVLPRDVVAAIDAGALPFDSCNNVPSDKVIPAGGNGHANLSSSPVPLPGVPSAGLVVG